MFRTHTHLHFNPRGDCVGIAIELFSDTTGQRLALVVSEPGPFDDFTERYEEVYQRAVGSITQEVEGQVEMWPQAHPRVLLRRATDLAGIASTSPEPVSWWLQRGYR